MAASASECVVRIPWPHDRLCDWARWARCALPGAEGSSEGYLRERTDPSHPGEPTPEIAITETAVARMKHERRHYWKTFAMFYLQPGETSEYEIGQTLGENIERVTATLRQSRILVGYHIKNIERVLTLPSISVDLRNLSALSRATQTQG